GRSHDENRPGTSFPIPRTGRGQRPWNLGSRFCTKASMASAVSAELKLTVWQVASYSRAWASEDSAPTWSWALIIDNANGGPAANREAHSSTALSSSEGGTTRFTNPPSNASAAEMTMAQDV